MSLRQRAQRDIARITTNKSHFGWPVVISYKGKEYQADCFSNNIGQTFDSDTGTVVSGQTATASISVIELQNKNIPEPVAVYNENRDPYLVSFNDGLGRDFLFKVVDTYPDRTLGLIVCILERFKDGA